LQNGSPWTIIRQGHVDFKDFPGLRRRRFAQLPPLSGAQAYEDQTAQPVIQFRSSKAKLQKRY